MIQAFKCLGERLFVRGDSSKWGDSPTWGNTLARSCSLTSLIRGTSRILRKCRRPKHFMDIYKVNVYTIYLLLNKAGAMKFIERCERLKEKQQNFLPAWKQDVRPFKMDYKLFHTASRLEGSDRFNSDHVGTKQVKRKVIGNTVWLILECWFQDNF